MWDIRRNFLKEGTFGAIRHKSADVRKEWTATSRALARVEEQKGERISR